MSSGNQSGSEISATGTPDDVYEELWRDLDGIAAEITASWPKGVSAEDAINDVRREL